MANTTLLPIAYSVDAGDFLDSRNLSIYPMGGNIPVNGSQMITLTFICSTPLMLSGKFSISYSDITHFINNLAILFPPFAIAILPKLPARNSFVLIIYRN